MIPNSSRCASCGLALCQETDHMKEDGKTRFCKDCKARIDCRVYG